MYFTLQIKAADIAALKSEVEKERKYLRSLQEAVDSLSQFVTKDKHALTSKLQLTESKAQECKLALQAQCQENIKVSANSLAFLSTSSP